MLLPIGDDITKRHLPIVTGILIIANVLVFALQTNAYVAADDEELFHNVTEMYSTWGFVPAKVFSAGSGPKEWMTLVTHMFMHGGFMHLLGNMIVLWAFGYSLEGTFGWATFLGMYLAWGLVAAFANAIPNLSSEIPCVGASGAIAGVMGAYTLMFGYNTNIRTVFFFMYRFHVIHIPASVFGGIWIIMQFWNASFADMESGGVAWFAHIGGFIAGVVTMAVFKGDAKTVLVESRGELQLKDRDELVDSEEEEVLPGEQEMAIPVACPYCETKLAEENRMTNQLARCPNDACQRMVYLEEAIVRSEPGAEPAGV